MSIYSGMYASVRKLVQGALFAFALGVSMAAGSAVWGWAFAHLRVTVVP